MSTHILKLAISITNDILLFSVEFPTVFSNQNLDGRSHL